MNLRFCLRSAVFLLILVAAPHTVMAQDMEIPEAFENETFDVDKIPYPPQDAEQAQSELLTTDEGAEVVTSQQVDTQPPRFELDSFPSIMFTYWEQASILDSKNSRGMVRPPTEQEIVQDEQNFENDVAPDPGIRTIVLAGIAYKTAKNWTIWLNDQRVTPTAIPKEVLDLKVYENYIEIKWFDEYKNQIVPIRIRPHQRFNLDSRIFLPG